MVERREPPSAGEEARSESDFWDSPPRYSTASGLPIPLSVPPRPKPSLRRLILARLLFVTILLAVLVPIAYQVVTTTDVKYKVRALAPGIVD